MVFYDMKLNPIILDSDFIIIIHDESNIMAIYFPMLPVHFLHYIRNRSV